LGSLQNFIKILYNSRTMNRILQVDFFRGLFLIIITTNHFLSSHNIIHYYTYEFIGWITAAEGFVFLSGFTAGLVYSRKLVEKGAAFISVAAKKRAWTIYKYNIVIFLLLVIILFSHPVMKEYWLHDMREYKLLFQKPFLAFLLHSIFFYQPIYLDILPMYAIYILLLPFVLKYFQRGFQLQILAVSFLLYVIGTFNPVSAHVENLEQVHQVSTGFFNLLSWQFLFIGGLYLGFLTYQNKTYSLLQNKKLFYSSIFICALFFILKNYDYRLNILQFDLDYWVSKENLGPFRLLNFFAMLVVMSNIASRYKEWFTFKPICYLGRYSLEVFAFHILLIVLFKPIKEYTNSFYAVKLDGNFYIYPLTSSILFFVLIPALFLAPVMMNKAYLLIQRSNGRNSAGRY